MARRSTGLMAGTIGLLLLAGCATVQLVSDYDEQTDQSATKLQKDIATFFVDMGSAATPDERSFVRHQGFYKQASVDLDSMQVRAGALGHNAITTEQIGHVRESIAEMALLHKKCITGTLSDEQRLAIHDQGIDSSLDCRVAYGASIDAADRGDTVLVPAIASHLKGDLDQQLGAIEAFEIAKKRGQKETAK